MGSNCVEIRERGISLLYITFSTTEGKVVQFIQDDGYIYIIVIVGYQSNRQFREVSWFQVNE